MKFRSSVEGLRPGGLKYTIEDGYHKCGVKVVIQYCTIILQVSRAGIAALVSIMISYWKRNVNLVITSWKSQKRHQGFVYSVYTI
jgi:hypothetical protein